MPTLCCRITLIISEIRKDSLIVDPFFTEQELQELLAERNGKRWFGRKYKYRSEPVMVDNSSFLPSRLTRSTNIAAAYALARFDEMANASGVLTAESMESHKQLFPSCEAMVSTMKATLRFLGRQIGGRFEDSRQAVQTQDFQRGAQGYRTPVRNRVPIYGIKREDLLSWFEHYGANNQYF